MSNEPVGIVERTRESSNRERIRIECECCECVLSMHGRVLKRSAKAKAWIDLDDEADTLRKQITSLKAEIDTLKAAQVTPPPSPEPAPVKKPWRNIGEDE